MLPTWHPGHSCCVHGNDMSAVPWWWGPKSRGQLGFFMYNLILPLQFTHFHIDDDMPLNLWLVKHSFYTYFSRPAVFCSKLCSLSDTQHIHPIHLLGHEDKWWNQQCSKTLAFSCHESTAEQRTTPAFLDCLQYHTWAPNSWMDAHTCNCQDRLRLFPLVSVLTGQLQRTAETLCSFCPKTSAVISRHRPSLNKTAKTCVSLWFLGWSPLSCSSLCWQTPSPQTSPCHICCSHR